MELKLKYLNKLKTEQILAKFYTDHFDESDYGFVIDFNEEFLIIETIDIYSNYNGISIFYLENISRILWSGNDIENVLKLIDISKRPTKILKIDLSSIYSILGNIYNFYDHVSLYVQYLNDDIIFVGQIADIDENSIVIYEFEKNSSLKRNLILLDIDDITRIDAGGQYENNLQRLLNF